MLLCVCYHQGPSRSKNCDGCSCEVCDIYCAPFLNQFHPGGPILIADLKNEDFMTACKESALYAVNAVAVQRGTKRWHILIGIPGDKTRMNLCVYIPGNGTLWTLPVVKECAPFDKALLCTIYAAVHYLCKHPIRQINPKPTKNFKVERYKDRFRVFIDKEGKKVLITKAGSSNQISNCY